MFSERHLCAHFMPGSLRFSWRADDDSTTNNNNGEPAVDLVCPSAVGVKGYLRQIGSLKALAYWMLKHPDPSVGTLVSFFFFFLALALPGFTSFSSSRQDRGGRRNLCCWETSSGFFSQLPQVDDQPVPPIPSDRMAKTPRLSYAIRIPAVAHVAQRD